MKDYRVYLAQILERIGRVEEFTKVCIRKEDGTTSVQYFKQADGRSCSIPTSRRISPILIR